MKAVYDRKMLSEIRARAQRYIRNNDNKPARNLLSKGLGSQLLSVDDENRFLNGAVNYEVGMRTANYHKAADGYWSMFSLLTPVNRQNTDAGWYADLLDACWKPMILGEDRLTRLLQNIPLFSKTETTAILTDNYAWIHDKYQFMDEGGRKDFADDVHLTIAGKPVSSEPSLKYLKLSADGTLTKTRIN